MVTIGPGDLIGKMPVSLSSHELDALFGKLSVQVTAADKVGELDYTLVALILFIGPWRAGRIMNIGEPDFSTRALLVEGRATGADRLRWNLERSGFVVERASNGDEALKQSARFRPHVMLLNGSLPALSGIEVCRRLRALPETRDVGVIMSLWCLV